MTVNYVERTGTVATPYTVAQHTAYFQSASRNNVDNMTVSDVIGASLINLTSPESLRRRITASDRCIIHKPKVN